MCFNENWNTSASQMENKINEILPLTGGGSWEAIKLDDGNITVSKYPIIQSWQVYQNKRITASFIDLPSYFEGDVLVINSHFKCCGGVTNDGKRQIEADAIIDFLQDAMTPGGVIDLPQDTPFIILGDLNLVGDRQQLTTLVTGEIINTQIFGNGGPPDWDETDLEDLISQQTDKRTAYTWRNDYPSFPPGFPPGRLDFQIYSNSVMSVDKSFVIQTEIMSADRLTQYGLQQFDTRNASDHFPKVTDYSFTVTSVTEEDIQPKDFKLEQNHPNPFNPSTIIKFSIPTSPQSPPYQGGEAKQGRFVQLKVYDILGNEVATLVNEEKPAGTYEVEFSVGQNSILSLSSGVYFYTLSAGGFRETKKMILMR